MNNIFPNNSYTHNCPCGTKFIAPKGALLCHDCLYKRIAELEKDISFFKCCTKSGEIPNEGSEPSAIRKENDAAQARSKANE